MKIKNRLDQHVGLLGEGNGKVSIVVACYNTKEIMSKCLEPLLKLAPIDCEIFLIYNHPPYEDVLPYLIELSGRDERIVLVDRNKNLGCHGAMNYGFQISNGSYLIKLDDDTEVVPNFAETMIKCLDDNIDIAYIATDCTAKHNTRHREVKHNGYTTLELWNGDHGIIGYPCVMFRRSFFHNTIMYENGRLYGGEEVYYRQLAYARGLKIAKLKEIECIHHGVGKDTSEYGQWKYDYGFLAETSLDFAKYLEEKKERNK